MVQEESPAVGEYRYVPSRTDDVHIGGSALVKTGFTPRLDGSQEGAGEGVFGLEREDQVKLRLRSGRPGLQLGFKLIRC